MSSQKRMNRMLAGFCAGLFLLIPAAQAQQKKMQPWKPQLINVKQVTSDSIPDQFPVLCFSAQSGRGALIWCKYFTGPHHDMYHASYASGIWGGETYVPDQMETARHWFFSMDFDPVSDDLLVSFGSSKLGSVGTDEIYSRFWSGAWDGGPTLIGDGINDDDLNGAVRYGLDGTYGLAVWADEEFGSDNKRRAVANIWDPATTTWGAKIVISPATGTIPDHIFCYDRCLAQDPVTGKWVAAYQKRPIVSGGVESAKAEAAYRSGSASVGGAAFDPEQQITNDSVFDGPPLVSFTPNGDGALFWDKKVDGLDRELMAAVWNGDTALFGAPIRLTDNNVEDRVYAAIPDVNGWHLIFTRWDAAAASPELYYGHSDGTHLGQILRLTQNTEYEGTDEESYTKKGIDAALSPLDGSLHIAWVQWDGSDIDTMEIYMGELLLLGRRKI